MNFEEFKKFVERQTVKKFEKKGVVVPVFLIVNQEHNLEVVSLNEIAYLGKELVSDFLREYCQSTEPLYTAHVAEANVVRFTNPEEFNKHISASEKYSNVLLEPVVHPDKEDMLVMSFCSNTGERHVMAYRIIDPVIAKRKLEFVDSYQLGKDDNEGLFANLI
jgi:hypothetical protein